MFDEIELAYIAGIVDGEGTFGIMKDIYKMKKHPNWNPSYAPYFSIGMSDKSIVELIQKYFGGNIKMECVQKRKDIFRLRVYYFSAKAIAEALLPYLRIKKAHAENVISFFVEKIKLQEKPEHIKTPELQRREELYLKIRELNATGATATTKRENNREVKAIV